MNTVGAATPSIFTPGMTPRVVDSVASLLGMPADPSISRGDVEAALLNAPREKVIQVLNYLSSASQTKQVSDEIDKQVLERYKQTLTDVKQAQQFAPGDLKPFTESKEFSEAIDVLASPEGSPVAGSDIPPEATIEAVKKLSEMGVLPKELAEEANAREEGATTMVDFIGFSPDAINIIPDKFAKALNPPGSMTPVINPSPMILSDVARLSKLPPEKKKQATGYGIYIIPRTQVSLPFGPPLQTGIVDTTYNLAPEPGVHVITSHQYSNVLAAVLKELGLAPTSLSEVKDNFYRGGAPQPFFPEGFVPGLLPKPGEESEGRRTPLYRHEVRALANNMLKALATMPLTMLAAYIDDPVEFGISMLTFPIQEAKLIRRALGNIYNTGKIITVNREMLGMEGSGPLTPNEVRTLEEAAKVILKQDKKLGAKIVDPSIPRSAGSKIDVVSNGINIQMSYSEGEIAQAQQQIFDEGGVGVLFLGMMLIGAGAKGVDFVREPLSEPSAVQGARLNLEKARGVEAAKKLGPKGVTPKPSGEPVLPTLKSAQGLADNLGNVKLIRRKGATQLRESLASTALENIEGTLGRPLEVAGVKSGGVDFADAATREQLFEELRGHKAFDDNGNPTVMRVTTNANRAAFEGAGQGGFDTIKLPEGSRILKQLDDGTTIITTVGEGTVITEGLAAKAAELTRPAPGEKGKSLKRKKGEVIRERDLTAELTDADRTEISKEKLRREKLDETPPVGRAMEEAQETATQRARRLASEGKSKKGVTIDPQTGLPTYLERPPENFFEELLAAAGQLRANIRWKKFSEGVLGEFRRTSKEDIIETSDIKDIGTTAHEFGHALDFSLNVGKAGHEKVPVGGNIGKQGKKFFAKAGMIERFGKNLEGTTLSEGQLLREAWNVSSDYRPLEGKVSASHKSYRARPTELMADFIAEYIIDPARTRALAPRLTALFEKKLAKSPDLQGVVRQLHEGNVEPASFERPGNKRVREAKRKKEGKKAQERLAETGDRKTVARRARSGALKYIEATSESGAKKSYQVTTKEFRRPVEELVRFYSREIDAKIAEARRISAKAIKRFGIPEAVRENGDMLHFMEGTENTKVPLDTKEALNQRMTPAMKGMVKFYRAEMELIRQNLNQFFDGLSDADQVKFLNDFVNHVTVYEGPKVTRRIVSKLLGDTQSLHERKFLTAKSIEEAGGEFYTKDPIKLYQIYSDMNWRFAYTKALVESAARMTDANGLPAIMEASKAPPEYIFPKDNSVFKMLSKVMGKNGKLIDAKGGVAVHPEFYRAMRAFTYEPPLTGGGFWGAVRTFVAFAKTMRLAFSFFHWVAILENSSAAIKGTPLSGLIISEWTDPLTGQKVKGFSTPATRGIKLLEIEGFVEGMIKDGIPSTHLGTEAFIGTVTKRLLSAEKRLALQSEKTVNPAVRGILKFMKGSTARAREFKEGFDDVLWNKLHAGTKAFAWNEFVQEIARNNPEMSPEMFSEIRKAVAPIFNDAFGGQEWATQFYLHPRVRAFMEFTLLAPDWTLSNMKIALNTIRYQGKRIAVGVDRNDSRGYTTLDLAKDKATRKFQVRYWRRMITNLAVVQQGMQAAIYQAYGDERLGDKRYMWENGPAHWYEVDITPLIRQMKPFKLPGSGVEVDVLKMMGIDLDYIERGGRTYTHLGKQVLEVLRMAYSPFREFQGKSSPLMQIGWEMLRETTLSSIPNNHNKTPMEYMLTPTLLDERDPSFIGSVVDQLKPFSLSGSNFFFALPVKKGMTQFQLKQLYRGALLSYTDPSLVRDLFTVGAFEALSRYLSMPKNLANPERLLVGKNSLMEAITQEGIRNGLDVTRAMAAAISQQKVYAMGQLFETLNDENSTEDDRLFAIMRATKLGVAGHSILKTVTKMDALKNADALILMQMPAYETPEGQAEAYAKALLDAANALIESGKGINKLDPANLDFNLEAPKKTDKKRK